MNTKKTAAPKADPVQKAAPTFDDVADQWLRLALQRAGSREKLAEALGVSRQMVHRYTKIPDRFAVKVEELYGIPRFEIAPEMFKGLRPKE